MSNTLIRNRSYHVEAQLNYLKVNADFENSRDTIGLTVPSLREVRHQLL